MEVIFVPLFLGYLGYLSHFGYCLIAMSAQIIFSFIIERKSRGKIVALVLSTQGVIVILGEVIYAVIYDIYHRTNLGLQDIFNNVDFKFDIFLIIIFIVILLIVGFFTYRGIERKMDYKKWIAFIFGYMINLLIMLFLMFKFGIMINSF